MLDHRLQRAGLLGDSDDWTGFPGVARRKTQNRVNQRAHRKRKREEAQSSRSNIPATNPASTSHSAITTNTSCLARPEEGTTDYALVKELWCAFYSAVGPRQIDCSSLERVGKLCKVKGIESEEGIMVFQQWAKFQNAASSPGTDCLLVLVKFNVFRALLSNGKTLGFSTARDYLDDGALSPFVSPMHPEGSLPSLPVALRPTKVQCQTPHHPWLDLFPDPVMRDNLIRACGAYDADELCADLIGLSSASIGRSGLIIWGEPWDPAGWEVTKPFLQHWGWVLRGCDELLRATNYWRQKRGEPCLQFDGVARN